jgi:ankyrin repeat protein
MVRFLLKAGADPKLKDKYGRTPAFLARRFGRKEVLPLLRQQK